MNVKTLRQEVRSLMKNHGFTQSDLSARTGIPQPRLSRFLSGAEMRSSHTLALLALIQDSRSACAPDDLTATPTTPPGDAGAADAHAAPQEAQDA